MKAAHKLLGAPTIGGGNAWAEDGGGGSLRRVPKPAKIHKNGAKNGPFPAFLA